MASPVPAALAIIIPLVWSEALNKAIIVSALIVIDHHAVPTLF